mmetsp:Transcript_6810/g.17553  ORF Transcript_6810/g.17553 Transcript_6810/m.17553 type:complete len:93 (-) Transcript_6810:134-412(-)
MRFAVYSLRFVLVLDADRSKLFTGDRQMQTIGAIEDPLSLQLEEQVIRRKGMLGLLGLWFVLSGTVEVRMAENVHGITTTLFGLAVNLPGLW